MCCPYRRCICSSVGIVISGAKGIEPATAVSAHVIVLDVAKIYPYVRELMTKEGREVQIRLPEIMPPRSLVGACPFAPRFLADGKAWRTQCKQVHDHHFAVAVVIVRYEAAFGLPTNDDRRCSRLHPTPVDAAVKRVD